MLLALAQFCDVLKVLYSFAGSWERVIYLLRSFARAAGGCARFCELVYIYGPGSSGKDVVLLLFLTFFGEAPDNLGCVLNGDFIVDASGGGRKQGGGAPAPGNNAREALHLAERGAAAQESAGGRHQAVL